MAHPVSARERVLDAFEKLVIESGERAATLDAVAKQAGVSKGGLLYHFGSKDALVDGIIDRLLHLVADDLERMRAAEAGAVDYFIRTSVSQQGPLDRAIIVCGRLAQASNPKAQAALQQMQRDWLGVIGEAITDPAVARIIMLIGDGVYFNSQLSSSAILTTPDEMDQLIAVVNELVASRARPTV